MRQQRSVNRGPFWPQVGVVLAMCAAAIVAANFPAVMTWLVMRPLWAVVCIGLVLAFAFVGLLVYLIDRIPLDPNRLLQDEYSAPADLPPELPDMPRPEKSRVENFLFAIAFVGPVVVSMTH